VEQSVCSNLFEDASVNGHLFQKVGDASAINEVYHQLQRQSPVIKYIKNCNVAEYVDARNEITASLVWADPAIRQKDCPEFKASKL
jgi:hypothetical protein